MNRRPAGLSTGSPTVPYDVYPREELPRLRSSPCRHTPRIHSLSRLTGARGPSCRVALSRGEEIVVLYDPGSNGSSVNNLLLTLLIIFPYISHMNSFLAVCDIEKSKTYLRDA